MALLPEQSESIFGIVVSLFLGAVVGAAEKAATAPLGDGWAFKIYLHDGAYREAVEEALVAAFGTGSQRLYLRGDMCRQELMVEIELFRHLPVDKEPW